MHKTTLDSRARITRSPDAVWREIDGCTAVISLDMGRVRTLNRTATAIWATLDGRTFEEVITDFAGKFPGTPRDTLERDLRGFVADLESRGLIQVSATG